MLDTVLLQLENIFSRIHPLLMFVIVILLGLYMFWRGCAETRKDRSSIFDMFIISTTLGLIGGRISYIINHWEDFSSFIWYWIPYEKYGNEIFLFRLLPWRFLRIWDWGIDILIMFVGFLLAASFGVTFVKKWKWSHMFPTVFFSVEIMFAISFLLLGGLTSNEQWLIQGIVLTLLPLVHFLLDSSIRKVMIGAGESRVLVILNTFFISITSLYISYAYLSSQITPVERISIYIFIGWIVFGIIYYILDTRKENVTIEKVSSVRVVSPVDVNQPIKFS